jgi:hypothetical protein
VGRVEAPARGLNDPEGACPPKPPVDTPCFFRHSKYALIDDDDEDEEAVGEDDDDAPHAVRVRARAATAKIRARGKGVQLLFVGGRCNVSGRDLKPGARTCGFAMNACPYTVTS